VTWTVSGTDITDAALGSAATPSADQVAWSAVCAAAVNAAITKRLNGYVPATASLAEAELTRSAILDGLEFFRSKDARFGVLSVGPDGEPVRVATDILWSVPVIARYATPGIG
jgi:hypothetical protein